jgi:predicted aldo/keto reductase-like oxidoreductase
LQYRTLGRTGVQVSWLVLGAMNFGKLEGTTRDSIAEAIDAGFQHIILSLRVPYPENVARWVTNELISLRTLSHRREQIAAS